MESTVVSESDVEPPCSVASLACKRPASSRCPIFKAQSTAVFPSSATRWTLHRPLSTSSRAAARLFLQAATTKGESPDARVLRAPTANYIPHKQTQPPARTHAPKPTQTMRNWEVESEQGKHIHHKPRVEKTDAVTHWFGSARARSRARTTCAWLF